MWLVYRLNHDAIGTHNAKPHPASPQKQKAAFIRDKYELRRYVRKLDAHAARTLMWQAVFEVRFYLQLPSCHSRLRDVCSTHNRLLLCPIACVKFH